MRRRGAPMTRMLRAAEADAPPPALAPGFAFSVMITTLGVPSAPKALRETLPLAKATYCLPPAS